MAVDQESLKSRFSYLVPLNKLPADRQARLLAQSEVIELRKKDILFRQGDRDDFTYYVLEGDLEMLADESLIKRVSGGDGASFQPLAQLQPRQMTAVAKTKASVLRVRRSLLEQLLSLDVPEHDNALPDGVEVEEMEVEHSADWLMTLLQSELFTRIPPSNIQGLLDTLEPIEVKAGDEIIKQGEPGEYYYALQRGTCEVVRKGSNKREIRLAELGPGDTFGEEALISGARRNATVRMTSDGELARLTKADFTRLIKAPLLTAVSRAEAEARVASGARWLDVRFEDEHGHNGLPGSLNIPLGVLRTRAAELDDGGRYVAYCDSGGRSSAAAFLLAERGFDVCYVEGGAVDEPLAPPSAPGAPAAPAASSTPAPPPTVAPPVVSTSAPVVTAAPPPAELMLEAAARASSLGAEVAKADLTIEQAQKMMAEAQAMKAEAERYVADKLERERARLSNELAELQHKVSEAEGLKAALGAREQAAQAEAARQQAEAAAREQAVRAELERRQAEAVAQEQALRAEIERRQAEVAAREQATRRELEQQQAEAVAREQAARAELERLQAEASQREQAARAELERLRAEAAAREQAAHAELERQRAEAAAREQAARAELERQQAEVAAREQASREALARQQAEIAAQARAQELEFEARTVDLHQRMEEEARRLNERLAEAERVRGELAAQQHVAQQAEAARHSLAEEQARIQQEAAALNHKLAEVEQLKTTLERQQRASELEVASRQRLQEQQQRIEQEAALLTTRLAEAEKLKATLLKQQALAEQEVAREHEEVDQRLAALEQTAAARLREEEQRLAELYQQQADRLESLQAGREAELRDALRKELAAERGKFEMAVSRATAELERAREERAAAIAAKEATAAEARRMIEDYKRQQQALLAEQQTIFAREREKLRAEAERIDKLKAEAMRVRREAEAYKAAAERELSEARQRQAATSNAGARREIDDAINEIQERASAANRELNQAIEAETAIVSAAEEHEDELERTYNTATEINQLLHKELKDWVGEHEEAQDSHLQREILARQKEMVERIRARAAAAKAEQKQRAQDMLDEIQLQLTQGK